MAIIKLLPGIFGVLGTLFLIWDSRAKLGAYGVIGISLVYWGFAVYAAEVCYENQLIGAGVIGAPAIVVLYGLAIGLKRRKGV